MSKFLGWLLFVAGCLVGTILAAQVRISGRVVFDQKPVSHATVYLNNTSLGTVTNQEGAFILTVPEGSYELIISHVGFQTVRYKLTTTHYTEPLLITLAEDESLLDEVVVSANRNQEQWQYNYEVFLREFIGIGELARSCAVRNTDVLDFDYDPRTKTLIAEASEPLRIRNEALGYDIYYDLVHFSIENNYTRYAGYAYFKELEGGKGKQKRWKKNRLRAYRGSSVHFFKSVVRGNSVAEGFVINQFARKKNSERPSPEEIAKARTLIQGAKGGLSLTNSGNNPQTALDSAQLVLQKVRLPEYIDYLYKSDLSPAEIVTTQPDSTYLQFNDNLSVVYTRELEEEAYILRTAFSKARKPLPQTSSIIPLADKMLLLPTGILADPLSIVYEGYWSYEKLGHALPLDYEPEE